MCQQNIDGEPGPPDLGLGRAGDVRQSNTPCGYNDALSVVLSRRPQDRTGSRDRVPFFGVGGSIERDLEPLVAVLHEEGRAGSLAGCEKLANLDVLVGKQGEDELAADQASVFLPLRVRRVRC